jgi:hypothetical protein
MHTREWKYNIKSRLKEICSKDADVILVDQDKGH